MLCSAQGPERGKVHSLGWRRGEECKITNLRAINRVSQLSRHVSRDCHECPGVTGDLYLVSIGSLMVKDSLDTPGGPRVLCHKS